MQLLLGANNNKLTKIINGLYRPKMADSQFRKTIQIIESIIYFKRNTEIVFTLICNMYHISIYLFSLFSLGFFLSSLYFCKVSQKENPAEELDVVQLGAGHSITTWTILSTQMLNAPYQTYLAWHKFHETKQYHFCLY